MKFQKEDAYKELVGKMTANGEKLNLSERSINEQLDTLIPVLANEETELADFVVKVLPIFKTADANVRNDVSVSVKKIKEEVTKPQPPTQPQNAEGLDALLERVKQLEVELEEGRKRQKNETTRNDLFSKLKEKGVNDEEWLSALLNEITIGEDFDVDAKATSLLALYNKTKSQIDDPKTPEGASAKAKMDRINDAIKQAAEFAKSQNLIGN
jgi:hypothetical protein